VRRVIGLLIAAAAIAVAAAAIPSPALMPVAVALALVAVGASATTAVAARRIVVDRSLPVHEAREDEPLAVRFAIDGLGRLPVTVSARAPAGGWTPLGPLGGEQDLAIGRRGAYRLGPSSLRLRDALGIVERHLLVGRSESLLILPAPYTGLLAASQYGGTAGEPEPDGLRPYVPGTPLTRIHWPALARGGGLHARGVRPAPEELPLVIVDTGGSPAPEAVDWAARAAAGHILRLLRAGGCRVVLPGDRMAGKVTRAAEWQAVQRRLATMRPTPVPAAALPPGIGAARTIRISAAAVAIAALAPPAALPPGVEPDTARR
jgi:uncharacterized protein (DUF58 family)